VLDKSEIKGLIYNFSFLLFIFFFYFFYLLDIFVFWHFKKKKEDIFVWDLLVSSLSDLYED
jgi:hypothetical protein